MIASTSYFYSKNRVKYDKILAPAKMDYDMFRSLWKEGGKEKVLDILTERLGEKQAKVILQQVPVTFLDKTDFNFDLGILKLEKKASKINILHEGLVYVGDLAYVTVDEKKVEKVPEARIYINFSNLCGLLAINGIPGTGKSTAVRIFAEGFSLSRIPVIIIDIEGDYTNMYMVNKNLPFYSCEEVFKGSQKSCVRYYNQGSYYIDLRDFNVEEIVDMVKSAFPRKLSDELERGLYKAIARAKNEKKHFDWYDIIESVDHVMMKADYRVKLLDILKRYNPTDILRGPYHLNIKNMLTPINGKLKGQKMEFGQINIIDVRGLTTFEIKMVIYYIFSNVLKNCTVDNENRVAMFFDESTLFMEEYQSKINDYVKEVAERGRKRGILLGLVPRAIANLPPGAKRETMNAVTFHSLINSTTKEKLSNWGVPEQYFEWIKLFRKAKGGWALLTGRFCDSYFIPATPIKRQGINMDQFDLNLCIPIKFRYPITQEGIRERNRVKQKITI